MRTMLGGVLLVAAMSALPALAGDNSIGAWKINIPLSTYAPQPMPLKSYNMTRESVDDGVKVTITGERSDGTPINASYTAKFNGTSTPVSGSGTPYDSLSMQQENAGKFITEAKNSKNKYKATLVLEVAKDGKTMIITGKGTNADGKSMKLRFVFNKE